jgi:hypothetical protein
MQEKLILKELCRYPIGTWADIIYRNALLYPEDEAFIYGNERVTFAQFNGRPRCVRTFPKSNTMSPLKHPLRV